MVKETIFNLLKSKLYKSSLIEASAGTGKTNIVSLLYLRFLLKINISNKFNNLNINNILIVTFTDLATLEIKSRILNNIRFLKESCILKKCVNNEIIEIYEYIKNSVNIINLLIQLEYQIDNISIFTIHSFCKKIIFNNFLEFNINYNSNIISNEFYLIYELVIIYWYKNISNLSSKIIKIIITYWYNYNKLHKTIIPLYNHIKIDFNFNRKKYKNINSCYKFIINHINIFKSLWNLKKKYIYNYLCLIKKHIKNIYDIDSLFKEINLWVKDETLNFNLPNNLIKLSYNSLIYNNIVIFKYDIFIYIEYLLYLVKDLHNYIILDCIFFINKNLEKRKKKYSLISFNDLIIKLNNYLNIDFKESLINILRKNFPIVLIDEFQDTDIYQFNIFNNIYIKNNTNLYTKIILIGDIKQSIYSFRGANIFHYISIKKLVNHCYTFNINWRTSYFLNKSINYIFSYFKYPFYYKEILYIKSKSCLNSKKFYILKNKKLDSSLKIFYIYNYSGLNKKYKLAEYCAYQILNLLNKKYSLIDKFTFKNRYIKFSDISILVYNNNEINIILEVFNKFNLPIIGFNNTKNIFNISESLEIYYIIKSILNPVSKLDLKNALLTKLFGYNIFNINKFINNNKLFNYILEEFYLYYDIWNNHGFYSMIKFIIKKKKIIIKKLNNFNKYITNILHISEILYKVNLKLNDKFLLLNWFENKLKNINNICKTKYYIRSSYYKYESINVTTIHKSKGLQYNIVWLPFLISLSKYYNYYFFNNKKNFKYNIDLYKFKFNKNLMLNEIYSEEIRILYVALTRAIYQCNIFLYNNNNINNYFRNIYSYINNIFNIDLEKKNINFSNIKYKFIFIKYINLKLYLSNYEKKIYILKQKKGKKNIINYKNISLCKFNKNIFNYSKIKLLMNYNFNLNINIKLNKYNKYNLGNLPKGKKIGNVLHYILEIINFKNELNFNYLLFILYKFQVNKKWIFIIKYMLLNLLNYKFIFLNVNLVNIKYKNIFKEFNFVLSLKKKIDFDQYFNLSSKYDLITKSCLNNNIEDILYGYLDGVIDLIFIYKNCYYIVDYKTNWLGYHYTDYNYENMFNSMCDNRYDIQYQIYSIALHRYLNIKLSNYNYNVNFGGIYYIFLRGLNLNSKFRSIYGIYYIKPKFKLINKLNLLLFK